MLTITKPTMHELHDNLGNRLLYSTRDKLDHVSGASEALFSDVTLYAENMKWDYDLKRVWVPPSRWTTMVRQYLNQQDVEDWLDLVEFRSAKRGRGDRIILRTNRVRPRGAGTGTTRNLGSCMLHYSIGHEPYPQISMHSRTCYIGYLSPLDMSVAYHLGRLAAERVGRYPIEEYRFKWTLETAQYHEFRTIAHALGSDEARELFDERRKYIGQGRWSLDRAHKHRDLWDRQNAEGVLYEEMRAFRSYQRLRKRYNTEVFGYDFAKQFETPDNKAFPVLPSTPVKSLTFEKIGIPG